MPIVGGCGGFSLLLLTSSLKLNFMSTTLLLDSNKSAVSDMICSAGYVPVNKGLAYEKLCKGVPVLIVVNNYVQQVISLSKLANWCLYLMGKTPVRLDYEADQIFYIPE
jgi:hypothetical protein